ncbi:MAG: hypothetical protein ABW154_07735 [Dyella sp.]
MITTILLALSAAAPAISWCRSVEQVALATAEAHATGVPRDRVEAGITLLPTPAAREAAEAITEIVYVYNADRGVTPTQLAALVYSACVSKEQ